MSDLDEGRTMALRVGTEGTDPFWITRNGQQVALVIPKSTADAAGTMIRTTVASWMPIIRRLASQLGVSP